MSIPKSEKEQFIELIKDKFIECEAIRPDATMATVKKFTMTLIEGESFPQWQSTINSVANYFNIPSPYDADALKPSLDFMKQVIADSFEDSSVHATAGCSDLFMEAIKEFPSDVAHSETPTELSANDYDF